MPQEKYRSACDYCSASKIKCTQRKTSASKIKSGQEKPQCIRCRVFGRECHYSKSRRAGRPSSDRKLQPKTSKAPASSGTGTPTISPATLSIKPEQTTTTAATVPQSNPPLIPEENNLDVFQFPDFLLMDSSPASASSSERGSISRSSNDGSIFSASSSDEGFFSASVASQDWLFDDVRQDPDCFLGDGQAAMAQPDGFFYTPSPPSINPKSKSESEDRSKFAMESQNNFCVFPTGQVQGNETVPSSISQAMVPANGATQTTHQMMSSEKDFYLPVIIAMIVSKIMTWHQAMAYSPEDPYTEFSRQKFGPKDVAAEGKFPMGTFQLESEIQRVLKNQIVLDQLRNDSEVVARYHSMFRGDGAPGYLGGRLYTSMSAFLDSGLQCTIQEIESNLRRSGSS